LSPARIGREPGVGLGVSFRVRILLLILGLGVAGMGGLVLSMARWVRVRTEADLEARLANAAQTLTRLHPEEARRRALRFEGMALEPHYVALAQVLEMKDREATLHEQLEEHDLARKGWAAMGFVSPEGKILAWGGKAREEAAASMAVILKRVPRPVLVPVQNEVLELFSIALHPPREPERITGFMIIATPFTSAILDEYALVVGGAVELCIGGGRGVASRRLSAGGGAEQRAIDVPLEDSMSFRFRLDVDQVAGPLREQLRILMLIAVGVVLVGSGASFWIAGRMARPIGDLARAAKAVGEGDLTVRAEETGAPELQVLARNFNEMVGSLHRSREEIKTQAREILEVGERERERFAQDLHDGLGQDLAGIALHCQALEKRLSATPSLGAPEAVRIAELVRRTIEKARSLGRGLFPVGLEKNDLETSLEEMATFMRQTFHVSCVIDWDPRVRITDRSVATNLYWIAQEAATNAVRHAHPKNVWVRVAAADGRGACLTVRDDGSGLPERPEEKGGVGLRIMKSRAQMIGASFLVETHPDGGTSVTCQVERGVERLETMEKRS
jgi:signal transduction histidine kinase